MHARIVCLHTLAASSACRVRHEPLRNQILNSDLNLHYIHALPEKKKQPLTPAVQASPGLQCKIHKLNHQGFPEHSGFCINNFKCIHGCKIHFCGLPHLEADVMFL